MLATIENNSQKFDPQLHPSRVESNYESSRLESNYELIRLDSTRFDSLFQFDSKSKSRVDLSRIRNNSTSTSNSTRLEIRLEVILDLTGISYGLFERIKRLKMLAITLKHAITCYFIWIWWPKDLLH